MPGRPAPSSRRWPRWSEVVTFRIRVDLKGTRPPLWRRFELASDLFLDQVHDIIQIAFGWTDSHLHGFSSGPGFYGAQTERYLCPFDVAEGETGVPEGEVRLDEVLSDPGDKLYYTYDYGDDWQHVIALEAVLPRIATSRRAACTGGRRPGPAEDCGGVHAYELIEAATDPGNPDHADAVLDLAAIYGGDVGISSTARAAFSVDEINDALLARDSVGPARPHPLLGTPQAAAAPVHLRRADRPRRPPTTAAARPDLALGRPAHRRDHPPPGSRPWLIQPQPSPANQERKNTQSPWNPARPARQPGRHADRPPKRTQATASGHPTKITKDRG
jgi:hypothetical protein